MVDPVGQGKEEPENVKSADFRLFSYFFGKNSTGSICLKINNFCLSYVN